MVTPKRKNRSLIMTLTDLEQGQYLTFEDVACAINKTASAHNIDHDEARDVIDHDLEDLDPVEAIRFLNTYYLAA